MKNYFIPILVVIFIAVTTVLYGRKIAVEADEIDKATNAMQGISSVLSPASKIGYQSINVCNEMRFWAKYVLAPMYIGTNNFVCDTVLTICPTKLEDSIAQNTLTGRKRLWKNNDGQYAYFLTTKP